MVLHRVAVLGLVLAWTTPVVAEINLAFRPMEQTVSVGDTVSIGLYAVSDDNTTQLLSAIRLLFAWQPAFLQLGTTDHPSGIDGWSVAAMERPV